VNKRNKYEGHCEAYYSWNMRFQPADALSLRVIPCIIVLLERMRIQ
jgi:hypothetical protein